MWKLTGLILGATLCLQTPAPLSSKDDRQDDVIDQVTERVLGQVQDWFERIGDDRKPEVVEPLGQTVKIQFEILPADKNSKPISILCATNYYAASVHMREGESELHFSVAGMLSLTKEGGDILLTYETELESESEQKGGSLGAEGSAVLRFGKPKTVVQFGDKALQITVEVAE